MQLGIVEFDAKQVTDRGLWAWFPWSASLSRRALPSETRNTRRETIPLAVAACSRRASWKHPPHPDAAHPTPEQPHAPFVRSAQSCPYCTEIATRQHAPITVSLSTDWRCRLVAKIEPQRRPRRHRYRRRPTMFRSVSTYEGRSKWIAMRIRPVSIDETYPFVLPGLRALDDETARFLVTFQLQNAAGFRFFEKLTE